MPTKPAIGSTEATPGPNDMPPPVDLSGSFAPDQVLIRFRRNADGGDIDNCLQSVGATVRSQIEALSVLVLNVPEGSVGQSIATLRSCAATRFVEPNYTVEAQDDQADTLPTDPGWPLQYGLVHIRAPQGWDLETGSPAVTIAIVDTGVDLGHPDLAGKIVAGYDFVNDDSDPQDDNGHGTHVAGIAAAVTNNGTGIAGVSWGARIMPIKVLSAMASGSYADVAAGVIWAVDHGAQIINLSLGGTSPSEVMKDAVDYAYAKGAIMVAAVGNAGGSSVLYPARYPQVIAVAATDESNQRASFSNHGPEVDLAAPGVSIYSTYLGGSYVFISGTSMSTPFVSGLAAILRGVPGAGSPDAIASEIESTALDLGAAGRDDFYGFGLIQMDAALRAVLPSPPHEGGRAGQGIGGGVYGLGSPLSTFTPTFTPTATLALTWTPTTIVLTPATATLTSPGSETPEVVGQSMDAPAGYTGSAFASALGSDWPVGCSGASLIVFGAVLAGVLSRRQGRRQHHRYFSLLRR